MARGDSKSASYSYRGSSGATYSYTYDDEGRGYSKTLWEIFERTFNAQTDARGWLYGTIENCLSDGELYNYIQNMTSRYNVHDWAWNKFDDPDGNDGRVRRLIVKICGEDVWHTFQTRAKRVVEEHERELEERRLERDREWQQQRAAFEAEQIKRTEELVDTIDKDVDLVVGALRSDFDTAFAPEDVYYQNDGDWLDDVTTAYTSGYGFGLETKQASGTKLQITISLDLSNSMANNKVDDAAAKLFRDAYLALEQLRQEHIDDMYVAAFEFSYNGEYKNEYGDIKYGEGRGAKCLSRRSWDDKEIVPVGTFLGAVEDYKHFSRYHFSGEDTWFYTLFEAIEKWENAHSDPGAYKLDLIITDAVIEHPSDLRRSDVVQERRDGSLQTVLLNLMPEREWVSSSLPKRCVQYPANKDNIAGLLRNVVAEFVGMYM